MTLIILSISSVRIYRLSFREVIGIITHYSEAFRKKTQIMIHYNEFILTFVCY